MASQSGTEEERELSLVSKLEMRIALTDTDEKLQSLLHTYLPPLLLKLGSESLTVRNKTIGLCQHVNARIQGASISLPVPALVKQFKDVSAPLVRHFDLIYLKQGLDRIAASERADLLPTFLDGISQLEDLSSSASIVFNLMLRSLAVFNVPAKGNDKDLSLRDTLQITPETAQYLSKWFGKLLMLPLGRNDAKRCPGLSEREVKFLDRDAPATETWNPTAPGGLNLIETKVAAMHFLASGAFHDSERFVPAVIASADPNSRLSDIADAVLKRFSPDLENPEVVHQLFTLYFGAGEPNEPDGVPPVRPPLQIKILGLLSKSVQATAETDMVERLINEGLLSGDRLAGQGLQGSRLRNQVFSFVAWFARTGSSSAVNHIAPNAIDGLSAYISSEGWPSPWKKLSTTELQQRTLAYESIGLLLPKANQSFDDDRVSFYTRTCRWLFVSLACDDSSDQIAVSIEQTLGSFINILAGSTSDRLRRKLRELLVRQIDYKPGQKEKSTGRNVARSTTFAAVRFANRCLPFSDAVGRWIALLASGSESPEIAEEGRKGLDPDWYRMLNPPDHAVTADQPVKDSRYKFPRFVDVVDCVFMGPNGQGNVDTLWVFQEPNFPVYLNSISFIRNLLIWEALEPDGTVLEVEADWDSRIDTVISTKEDARTAVKQFLRQCDTEPVENFLRGASKGAVLNHGLDLGRSLSHFVDIASLAPDALLEKIVSIASAMSIVIGLNPSIDQRTAGRLIGMLASHANYGTNSMDVLIPDIFVKKMVLPTETHGQDVGEVRGAVLALGYWFSRMSFRRRVDDILVAKVKDYLSTVLGMLENPKHTDLKQAILIAIGQLGLGGLVNSTTLPPDYTFERLAELIAADAKKGKELAIQTLGRISIGLYKSDESPSASVPFHMLTEPLLGLRELRDVEVQFAVGEALSVIAGGWRSKSLITEFDVDAELPYIDIPPYILTHILEKVLEGCKSPKPSEKKASVIWLLSLIRYCGGEEEIQGNLRTCQATFLRMLSDRDEIIQDTASRGLGLVYEMGSQKFKDELVRDLVQFFTADSSKLAGGSVSEGTELFEPGALPTGDGSVTTYKDIVNLASEVGNPSLVYRFMSLASDKAMWSSRAAFGRFGLSNVLSDSSASGYLSQNPKLYPKLYRYMFDPNMNVQTSMKGIWNALVKDSNAVIDTHFDAIMEELLQSIMNGKEWRVRQASCSAITDLIQSRPIENYDKYLNEILTKTFKVIDDIKESVRSAATRLGHALSGVVIRTLERGNAQTKRANLMLRHLVPFLLSQDGMESGSEEVRTFSISTLKDIIKKSTGEILRPFVPQILETFLMSLSSLESQAVNYIHLNAEKYGMSGQDVDKMRLSGLRSSPIMEVIERHLLDALDEDTMKAVAESLQNVMRSAIGMASSVGCSRVLVALCAKPMLFRRYADRFSQLAMKHVLDRNETIGASYSTALGYLARLSSDSQILKTIEHAKSLYFDAEDEHNRAIAGEITNSMSKNANDRVNSLAATFLPFIFIGEHDTHTEVKDIFSKVWSDNVSGPRIVKLYLNEILELVSGNLESPRWAVRHACALAVADAVSSLDDPIDLEVAELLWPQLQKAVAGRTWDGKGAVLEGFMRFAKVGQKFWRSREDICNEVTVSGTLSNLMSVLWHGFSFADTLDGHGRISY